MASVIDNPQAITKTVSMANKLPLSKLTKLKKTWIVLSATMRGLDTLAQT